MPPREDQTSLRHAEQLDRVLRLLASEPRRRLIGELLQRSESTWITLPETIWSPDLQMSPDELSVLLCHQHLPALSDADYVRWRSTPLEAGRGPKFDEIGSLMKLALRKVDYIPPNLVRGSQHLATEANET